MNEKRLLAVDWLIIIYLFCLSLAIIIFRERISRWNLFILIHLFTIALIPAYIFFTQRFKKPIWRWLRDWYPALLLLPLFSELSFLIHPIHPKDYDANLALIDLQLFGVDPIAWLQHLARPWLTEILQLAYASFYLFPLGLLLILYFTRRLREYRIAQFGMLLCFFLSYVGYFLVPALGPRFYAGGLAEAPQGLLFTQWIQETLNYIERAGEMRDVFPSGHTAIALMVQVYTFRWFRWRGFWLLPLTSALLISTVYLGYHYVIDVIAGALLAAICLVVEPRKGFNSSAPLRSRLFWFLQGFSIF